MALVEEAGLGRRLRHRHAVAQQPLRIADPAMADVAVRRQPDLAAEHRHEAADAQARQRREVTTGFGVTRAHQHATGGGAPRALMRLGAGRAGPGEALLAFDRQLPGFARAQAGWPGKPVRLVVPFAAGGPTDKVARDLAEALRKPMGGATIIIDNVGGAGGTLGAAKVAKAAEAVEGKPG